MTTLGKDIAAYDKAKAKLEAEHRGEWAVFRAGAFVGLFPDFQGAAEEALDRFGAGPYLIRQIGVETVQLSSAMVFKPAHAHGSGGI